MPSTRFADTAEELVQVVKRGARGLSGPSEDLAIASNPQRGVESRARPESADGAVPSAKGVEDADDTRS